MITGGHRQRAGRRGAAMVEAIVVISIFILFFLGMVYFYSLYFEKIRVRQLARTAALAYAMDACQDSDPLAIVKKDMGSKGSGQQSTGTAPGANAPVNDSSGKIGDKGGDPVGGAMGQTGFAGFQITDMKMNSKAGSVIRRTLLPDRPFMPTQVSTESFVACGDPQKNGDPAGVWDYIKDSFSLNMK